MIAEGIEDRTQLSTLRALGCPLGQGFLFAKPLPLADAQRLMQESADDPTPARASDPEPRRGRLLSGSA